MTHRLAPLAAALLLSACAAAHRAGPPPAAPGADEARVRQALERWNEAAGRGDVGAFMAQFDGDAEILLVGSDRGEVFRGRAAAAGWLGKLLARNRFGWEMDRVELSVLGDAAWVFVEGRMTVRGADGTVRGSTPYRFSGVLVRRGDDWAWRLFHGSVPGGH